MRDEAAADGATSTPAALEGAESAALADDTAATPGAASAEPGSTPNGEREGGRRRGRGGRHRREGRPADGTDGTNGADGVDSSAGADGPSDGSVETQPPASPMQPDTAPATSAVMAEAAHDTPTAREAAPDALEAQAFATPVEIAAAHTEAAAEAVLEAAPEPTAAAAPATPREALNAPAVATADVEPAPPAVGPYALPVESLQTLAASAGLEWVNSDAERIIVVQQAMANEPKPVHVPRAPRPRLVVDEGPLVLVETRKDLSQMKLPFEQPQPPAAG